MKMARAEALTIAQGVPTADQRRAKKPGLPCPKALSLTHPTCVRVQTQAISNPATKSVVSACFCSLLL